MSLHRSKAFWWSVAVLVLPVAAQMLLQSLLGMADVMMVSSLGTTAVAAVGLAAKIHFLLIVLMNGLGTGCSVLVSQYTGARDFPSCQRIMAVTLLVGAVAMVPFTLLFAVNPGWWLSLVNPDPEVVALAARYLVITSPVLIVTQLIVAYECGLRALGNTTMPLVAGAVSVVINIVLNYILIFGHLGFPAMGVAGAAWGTLVARILQLLFILLWIYLARHGFALSLSQFRGALELDRIRRFSWFVLPLVANYAIWAIGNTAYHLMTGFAGTQALAVMGVITPVEGAFFALFLGLANASSVMVGRALGSGDYGRAWHLYRFFDRLTLGLVLLLSLVLWLCKPLILGIFGEVDEQTRALLSTTLNIFCLLVWVKVIVMLRVVGVLRAGGDNRFVLVADSVATWVFGLPVFVLAVFFWGFAFPIIYTLLFLEDILKLVPVTRRIGLRRWIKNLTGTA